MDKLKQLIYILDKKSPKEVVHVQYPGHYASIIEHLKYQNTLRYNGLVENKAVLNIMKFTDDIINSIEAGKLIGDYNSVSRYARLVQKVVNYTNKCDSQKEETFAVLKDTFFLAACEENRLYKENYEDKRILKKMVHYWNNYRRLERMNF